ncbi:sec-independent translocase [Nocardioides pocheonensis]|uniref:Translocase n=1 Tax=Nocardioides pocheonensis TaxID=661485 RepID=A0A3N0GIW3_9ACTN|nr:sec-independent translocase [Nocardioides pocheonensis]RNM12058.1 translocase [Nocardioides pocheonensis]
MFGVGLPEIGVILLVAAVILGPDRLPDYARQAGQMIRTLRRIMKSTQDDLLADLGPEFNELELSDLDPRALIRKHILESPEDSPDARA